jgi:tetratricopeptide (TPR) repeat protein
MIFSRFKRKPESNVVPQAAAAAPVAALAEPVVVARLQELPALYSTGQVEAARELLEELARTNPRDLRVQTQLGVCHALLGDSIVARDMLLAVLQKEPENPDALKFLAISLRSLGELEECARVIAKAKEVSPQDMELHQLTGDVAIDFGNFDAAAAAYLRALEMQPESEKSLHRLEILGQVSESRTSYYENGPKIAEHRARVVRRMLVEHKKKGLDPDRLAILLSLLSGSPQTFEQATELANKNVDFEPMTAALEAQLQRVFLVAGDMQRSLALAERMFARDPDEIERKFHLGVLWVCSGEESWTTGWRTLTEVLTIARHYNHMHGVPVWEGQALGKRKLLVYQDQGFGDAILGFRFLPMLQKKGIEFEVWVQSPLVGLAERVPGVQRVIRSDRLPEPGVHGCQFATTFFGLISSLFLGPEEILDPPRVFAAPEQARLLRERIRALPGTRIGLLYGGNPRRRDDWLRSLPQSAIDQLARLQGVSWVNLMIDERPDKAAVMRQLDMLDPMSDVKNFHDTAALVEELDAVIAVDASTAHVAGNLGKPTWVLAPTMRDWRWQIGATLSPWWPTARLVRCDGPGRWDQAMTQVVEEVGVFLRERASKAIA